MADAEADVLVLNELPIPENRDLAWKMLRKRGDSVQLDSDLALTAQRTVEAVMRHPEIFSSKRAFDILNSPVPLLPLAFDPPEQTRYRHILQPFFSPRSIRPLEAGLRENAIDLIDPLVERGECDFVADIAEIFPVQAFLAFFGLPADDLPQFMVWKDAILESSDGSGTATESGSAHLARLEMKVVYEEWHKRIPAYQITEGTTPRVKWPRGTLGLDSLHLTFGGET